MQTARTNIRDLYGFGCGGIWCIVAGIAGTTTTTPCGVATTVTAGVLAAASCGYGCRQSCSNSEKRKPLALREVSLVGDFKTLSQTTTITAAYQAGVAKE